MRTASLQPLRDILVGVWAALAAPLYLRAHRLAALRAPASFANAAIGPAAGTHAARSARLSTALISRLARLPLPAWRNTCLYRSVAECLALRAHGVNARVVIGVRNANPPHGSIEAHAWVSVGSDDSATGYIPLESAETRLTHHVC